MIRTVKDLMAELKQFNENDPIEVAICHLDKPYPDAYVKITSVVNTLGTPRFNVYLPDGMHTVNRKK
jgi:hypothetical protein